ncbi:RanBD1 domain-containing protein [Mycena chlorophos]|uniref:RanBD1 domain-containing protein n=1 Tax=Mycena chlorophos TaxID=658473 RepID=A0A8H6RZI8_MYCCL|nr:RanBD1 domain-containing protein [Mycena chlorophos]
MLSDLNTAVVYGLAAFSAVGYAVARKIRPLPARARNANHTPPTPVVDSPTLATKDAEYDEPESTYSDSDPASLKRKREHENNTPPDLEYPLNLYSIYPRKRRTGSVSSKDEAQVKNELVEEAQVLVEEPIQSVETEPEPSVETEPAPVSDEVVAPPKQEQIAQEPAKPEDNPRSKTPEAITTPEPPAAATPAPVPAPAPRFVFPQTSPSPRFAPFPTTRLSGSTTTAFSGFAGSSSNPFFASTAGGANGSLNAFASAGAATVSNKKRSIWAAGDDEPEANDAKPALAAATPTGAMTASQTPLTTGEEDESTPLSLRGLTLFVKRGDLAFSSGVSGTLKLLAHKTNGSKRLLFRREPLWQVAMNVRLQGTGALRCTFDPRDSILRVIVKELAGPESPTAQTVIYAFKPGRTCKRTEFSAFAEALVVQAHQVGQEPQDSQIACVI